MQLINAEPFSEDIMKKAEEMRKTLNIPAVLDSPYFVARFLKANDGNEVIARERIDEYLIHRKCLRYGDFDQMGIFNECPIGKETFERFNISLVEKRVRSNNVHVFVQKMQGTDLKEIMKILPLSNVVHSYFLLQEVFGRVVAHTEKETGKPSSVVCILDLGGFNMADFLNPLSASVKLARIVVKVWADYFSENMCKILIINPPSILSIMWKVTKHIMDARTLSRISFLSQTDELKTFLEPHAIPEEYGGSWRDDSGYSHPPEGCCRQPKPVTSEEYKGHDDIWIENGLLKSPPFKSHSIKGHQKVDITRKVTSPSVLIWSFTTSGDVFFEILHLDSGKEVHVWPKINITSLKLPESGSIKVPEGDYVLRFTNPSSTWFPVKVNCAVEIKSQ